MLVDNCYPQQIVILAHFHHLCLDEHLFSLPPNNFNVSMSFFKKNPVLDFITLMCTGELFARVSHFLRLHPKSIWTSEKEYNQSGESNSSLQVGVKILNLLLLYE